MSFNLAKLPAACGTLRGAPPGRDSSMGLHTTSCSSMLQPAVRLLHGGLGTNCQQGNAVVRSSGHCSARNLMARQHLDLTQLGKQC